MKENYFVNIPPQEALPPLKKLPPREINPLPDQAADLEQAESASEAPEKSLDLMAAAEGGMNATERESSPEKMEIMENARDERLGILKNVFERIKGPLETIKQSAKEKMAPLKQKIDEHLPKPAQEIISQLMDASSMKMYLEAAKGKTVVGRKLSPKERVISALAGGTNDIAKCLFAYAASSGSPEYAQLGGLAYGASWALLLAKNGPKMFKNLKELAGYYDFSQASAVLVRSEAVFSQYGYQNFDERFSSAI